MNKFSDIRKVAYKIWFLSGKAVEIDLKDEVTIEKAKVKLTELIEQLEEIISTN